MTDEQNDMLRKLIEQNADAATEIKALREQVESLVATVKKVDDFLYLPPGPGKAERSRLLEDVADFVAAWRYVSKGVLYVAAMIAAGGALFQGFKGFMTK